MKNGALDDSGVLSCEDKADAGEEYETGDSTLVTGWSCILPNFEVEPSSCLGRSVAWSFCVNMGEASVSGRSC